MSKCNESETDLILQLFAFFSLSQRYHQTQLDLITVQLLKSFSGSSRQDQDSARLCSSCAFNYRKGCELNSHYQINLQIIYATPNRIKFLPHNACIVTQILVTKCYEFQAIGGASYGGKYTDDAIHEGLSVSVKFSIYLKNFFKHMEMMIAISILEANARLTIFCSASIHPVS